MGRGESKGRAIRFSELRNVPPAVRGRLLAAVIAEARAPANGRLDDLNSQIAKFEERYDISSDYLLKQLSEGTRKETADIVSWLMLLRLRERVESAHPF